MDAEASAITIRAVAAKRGRRRRAQHDIAANAQPISMPMAMQNDNTPGMRRQHGDEIGRLDQRQTNALAQDDRSHRIFDHLMVE